MRRVPAADLARLAEHSLLCRAVPRLHAASVASALVETSLRGVDTHGIALLPIYLAELDGGRARARPHFQWRAPAPALLRLDADGALGMVAGAAATDAAVRLARRHGVGVVSVRDSNHFGAASCYTLPMARAGLVGLALSNSDALVAPHGGSRPLIGTNPLSVAAPGLREPFCLDMATSQVSYSRIRCTGLRGDPLEPGWAVDAAGRDAAGPGAGQVSALSPLGGYKGQGLAMAVAIVCALLADAPLDHELSTLFEAPFDTPRQISHLFGCLDPSKLTAPHTFQNRLSRWLDSIRSVGSVEGAEVLTAGEREERIARERRHEGIPVSDTTLRDLHEIDRQLTPRLRIHL